MKIIIIFLLLTGCASVSYKKTSPDGTAEQLTIVSLFRVIKGLKAQRDNFELSIKEAQPTISPEELAQAMRLFRPL